MSIGKKIGIGIGIFIVGFVLLGVTINLSLTDERRAELEEERKEQELLETQKRIEEMKLKDQQDNPTEISHIVPSKMGNGYWQSDKEEAYYDQAEQLLSDYLLTFQGTDNSGLTMQDAMLMSLADKCGADVMLEKSNTETWVSISDWDDEKITVFMMTSSDINCAKTPAYYFDIYPQSGHITSEPDTLGGSKILLDFLEKFD